LAIFLDVAPVFWGGVLSSEELSSPERGITYLLPDDALFDILADDAVIEDNEELPFLAPSRRPEATRRVPFFSAEEFE